MNTTWKQFTQALDVKYGSDWSLDTLNADELAMYHYTYSRCLQYALYESDSSTIPQGAEAI